MNAMISRPEPPAKNGRGGGGDSPRPDHKSLRAHEDQSSSNGAQRRHSPGSGSVTRYFCNSSMWARVYNLSCPTRFCACSTRSEHITILKAQELVLIRRQDRAERHWARFQHERPGGHSMAARPSSIPAIAGSAVAASGECVHRHRRPGGGLRCHQGQTSTARLLLLLYSSTREGPAMCALSLAYLNRTWLCAARRPLP